MREAIVACRSAVVRVLSPDLGKAGTGFFVSPGGILLTNCHVVSTIVPTANGELELRYSTGPQVEYEGRWQQARIIHSLESTHPLYEDYAVLRIDTAAQTPWLTLGEYGETEPGNYILALGFPLGIDVVSATQGIVSAKFEAPSPENALFRRRVFLLDASVNPGNSGGPMIDIRNRRVVGMVSIRLGSLEPHIRGLELLSPTGTNPLVDVLVDALKMSNQLLNPGLGHAISIEYARAELRRRGLAVGGVQ